MVKKIVLAVVIAAFLGCHKNGQKQPVCAPQQCTDIFITIGVHFADKDGKAVDVKNYTVVNQRTKERMYVKLAATYDLIPGFFLIVDDTMRSELSTSGDDVLVSATHPTTNQTKTAMFKLSGGCNCHVQKLSGPDEIVFD